MLRSFFHCLIVVLFAPTILCAQFDPQKPVKYVFLFIGDGMSVPQRMMAEEFLRTTAPSDSEQSGLKMNHMESHALTTTHSANSFITDSAAAGTAIACGEKTNNGFIGVAADGRRLESVAELAKKNGRKVGIVTSVTLNHATPAAFYAHNVNRGNTYDIGLDLINSDFDYFGGGGIDGAAAVHAANFQGNLYDLAKEKGYVVAKTEEEIAAITPQMKKVIAVGSPGALPYAIDEKNKPEQERSLRLADFTKQAIEQLDNTAGFFIMVEGGSIDWACHANDAATALHEILEFDTAYQVARDFQKKHPHDTLVVVTGDHETGGLTLGNRKSGYHLQIELLREQKNSKDTPAARALAEKAGLGWATDAHTALPVSTTATGLTSIYFNGELDNTDIAERLKPLVGAWK